MPESGPFTGSSVLRTCKLSSIVASDKVIEPGGVVVEHLVDDVLGKVPEALLGDLGRQQGWERWPW
jgi:hypothetical protein